MSTSVQPSPRKPWETTTSTQAASSSVTTTSNSSPLPNSTPEINQVPAKGLNNSENFQVNQGFNNSYPNTFQNGNYSNSSYGNGYYNAASPYSSYSSGYGGNRFGMGNYNYNSGMGMGMGMSPGYMQYGSVGMPLTNFGMMLGSLHHATSSLGQMGELLGMNADALQYAFYMVIGFIEKLGSGSFDLLNFLTGRVDLSYYEKNPIIDPRNGQPLPPPTVEQIKKDRKEKTIRWAVGMFVLFSGYKILKFFILRSLRTKLSREGVFQKQWSKITGEEFTSQTPSMKDNFNMLSEAFGIPPSSFPQNQMQSYGSYGQGYGMMGYGNPSSPYNSYNYPPRGYYSGAQDYNQIF